MIYGFIIAAGNQTRFNDKKPKALVDINGTSCLDINIQNLGIVCDVVIVVCSESNEKYFKDYSRIVIDSGYGCGDAVLKALSQFDFDPEDTCFIQWGDCFVDKSEFYKRVINKYNNKYNIIIPCNYETQPYVKISQHISGLISVQFSKYGEIENEENGFHDMCVFYGDANILKFYCNYFKDKFYSRLNNKYYHKHGDEFNFLDIFNDTHIKGRILNIKHKYKCYSFNTEDEYNQILKEIR